MRSRWLAALLIVSGASAGCAPGARQPRVPTSGAPKREGAILLASPTSQGGGLITPFMVVGAPGEVVRGRVRWHVEPDGVAVRAREVTRDPARTALALPAWLGGGLMLFGDEGVIVAEAGGLRPVLRARVTSPSIGAKEVWARAPGGGDWIRIDPKGGGSWESSPIAAPILATPLPWSGALTGHPSTAGPEYLSPKNAFAIVDLLGPVVTHDGGETWMPLPGEALHGVFVPAATPTRLVRAPHAIYLANDEILVPMSPSGALGSGMSIGGGRETPPETAATHLEIAAMNGVPLADGSFLMVDGGRFVTATLDPVRVTRVSRAADLKDCRLRPSKAPGVPGVLAVVACSRRDEGPTSVGPQLVVGRVEEGPAGPRVNVEKIFPFATAPPRFAATGAIAVAGSCGGQADGGVDLIGATRICVRDAKGGWNEVAVVGVPLRLVTVPRSDGGVVVVRDDPQSGTEVVSFPRDAIPATVPARVRLDGREPPDARDVLSADEIAPGRIVVWRKLGAPRARLQAITVDIGANAGRVVSVSPPFPLDEHASVGFYGERALIASLARVETSGGADLPAIERVLVSTDAAATWKLTEWPASLPALDMSPSARSVECGASGCRFLGWTRIGWQTHVLSYDAVVDVASAPTLPAPPRGPGRSTSIQTRCTAATPQQAFDVKRMPVPRPTFYAVKPNDVLLGAPEPKLPAGYATHYARFVPGAARGGFVAWGPAVGAWGDLARVVVHFASDIDPLDAAYETLPIASPFSDRNAAARISSLQAIPLAPGRALVVMCEDRSRCPLLYRAVAGAALERIDVSPIGEVASITNARELGGALLVVGTLAQHDPKAPPWKVDRAPFAALVTPAGVISTVFPRAAIGEEPSFSATVDAARGRFGLMAASLLPTWRGGTTYVLPIDATARPSGGFELLRTSSFEVSRPLSACANAVASWDRVEVVTRAGWSTPEVEISIDGGSMIHDRGEMVVRARLGADATCLDRLTFLGTEIAFQWDPVSRRAVLLRLEPKGGAGRQELTCPSINW